MQTGRVNGCSSRNGRSGGWAGRLLSTVGSNGMTDMNRGVGVGGNTKSPVAETIRQAGSSGYNKSHGEVDLRDQIAMRLFAFAS